MKHSTPPYSLASQGLRLPAQRATPTYTSDLSRIRRGDMRCRKRAGNEYRCEIAAKLIKEREGDLMSEEQACYREESTMKIGTTTIDYAVDLARSLMSDYRGKIDEAYRKADDALTVNLSLKFRPKGDETFVEAGISFVAEKVMDKISGNVSETQMDLFEKVESGEISLEFGDNSGMQEDDNERRASA
jgi:hypothetical protein